MAPKRSTAWDLRTHIVSCLSCVAKVSAVGRPQGSIMTAAFVAARAQALTVILRLMLPWPTEEEHIVGLLDSARALLQQLCKHTCEAPIQRPQRGKATDGLVQVRFLDGRLNFLDFEAGQLPQTAAKGQRP